MQTNSVFFFSTTDFILFLFSSFFLDVVTQIILQWYYEWAQIPKFSIKQIGSDECSCLRVSFIYLHSKHFESPLIYIETELR